MRPLVHKKSDRMFINGNFEDEVRWSTRLDTGSSNSIMVGVNQSLVQIKYQDFLSDHVETVS